MDSIATIMVQTANSPSSLPDSGHQLNLEISGVSIQMRSFQQWEEESAFRPFIKEVEKTDYTAVFNLVDELPAFSETVLHEDVCYRVHPDNQGGFLRTFFDAPRDYTPYGVAKYDHTNGIIRIDCLPKGAHCVSEMHNSFFHIGFESILIHRKRLCLHAACVDTPLGGLLFSGPSGIGKSTQANLWHEHRGAKHINGDRPILSEDNGRWLAWGSPYAGSSHCHINENCPVTAIIMLQQAKNCSLRRLSYPEAFRAVWSGLTVHNWDKGFVEKAFDLTMNLIGSVPVFQFGCTPDVDAVVYLEQELRKECCL